MAAITLRGVKGLPLTNSEVDSNFNLINQELVTKASQDDLDSVETSLQSSINSTSTTLQTSIDNKLSNSAGSVQTTNYADASITPAKIIQTSQTWTFVGTLGLTGSMTVSGGITGASFSGGTGSFTNLTSTGPTNLGATVATSINNTPIGNITPSTGAFTTLSSSGGITGSLVGSFSGVATLDTTSSAITQAATDNSTKIATTAYTQLAGKNSQGTKTVSTSAPTGGVDGDIWYQY